EISGRYVELQETELTLFGQPVRLRVEDKRIRRRILTLDSGQHDTLTIRAECVDSAGLKALFRVTEVGPGPSFSELFGREIEKISAQDNSDLILPVMVRINKTSYKLKRPELVELAKQAGRTGLEIVSKSLEADDVDGRLAYVKKLHESFPNRRYIMDLLVDLESKFPRSNEIRGFLIGINCRKHRGQWMTYDEFKEFQGYTQHKGRWVSLPEKDFLETIERVRKRDVGLILRRRLDREYQILSTQGRVAIGMKAEEVHLALGFPDRVYRLRASGKEYTQWVYDSSYYYFVDELLVRTPDDDTEIRGN
ncbi:MAG: hypothetical protein AAF517_20415, partial [Planctomycetota bacterium]